jgi:hypothetical protein
MASHLCPLAMPNTGQHSAICLRQDDQKRHIKWS